MKPRTSFPGRTLAAWIALGVVLGAIGTATYQSLPLGPNAIAQRAAPGRTVANLRTEGVEMLRSLDEAFASISNYALASVVHIRAENVRGQDSEGVFRGVMGGEGSGMIYRPDGYIITNEHVVSNFDKVTVTLSDGREFAGKVIRSPDSDVAVVKIDATGLPALRLADSSTVKPGQFAIAVGSPFGLENTVTIGHVSAVGRRSMVPDPRAAYRQRFYPDMIQTDAAINMGNSGGPLLNVNGEVIGINTAIYSRTGENVGIGFAIPANQVRLIADLLIEKGKVVRGYLGVLPTNLKEFQKKEMGLEGGALVGPFDNRFESPARDAGIKEGDVVVRVGTIPIRNEMDLRNSMLRFGPGETVKVEVVRNGKRMTFDVKIGTPPQEAESDNPRPRQIRPRIPNLDDFDIPEMREFRRRFFEENEDVPPVRSGPARLGVTAETPTETLRKQFHIPGGTQGVVVTVVEPGSVAEKIGIQAGDVIQQLGNRALKTSADLAAAMKDVQWGDTRTIKIARFGENSQSVIIRDVKF